MVALRRGEAREAEPEEPPALGGRGGEEGGRSCLGDDADRVSADPGRECQAFRLGEAADRNVRSPGLDADRVAAIPTGVGGAGRGSGGPGGFMCFPQRRRLDDDAR